MLDSLHFRMSARSLTVRSSSWNGGVSGGVSVGVGGELPDRRFGFVAMDFPLLPVFWAASGLVAEPPWT
jgi:hypothetical protein